MKKLLAVFLICLILTGCAPARPQASTGPAVSDPTPPVDPPTAPPTVPPTAPPTVPPTVPPTEPGPENNLTPEQIELFQTLLDWKEGDPVNYYHMALSREFYGPEDVDLRCLFAFGDVRGPGKCELSQEERTYLSKFGGLFLTGDTVRMSETEMNAVLQQYFGISLAESNGQGLGSMKFYERTGCYYWTLSGLKYIGSLTVTGGMAMEDDVYRVYYDSEFHEGYAVTLQLVDGQWRILANREL